jgi:effector-binding domain-containing protein
MHITSTAILASSIFLAGLLTSCNGNNDNKGNTKVQDTVIKKSSTESKKIEELPARAPIINITDTVSVKKIVIVIKDSAATEERISIKLAEIFGTKLQEAIKKNNLKIVGPPMAWYQSQKAPYFFEAGFPVDKKPAKLSSPIKIKEIGVDSVILVHFYGPYNLTSLAYEAVTERMRDNKKKPAGAPYEIYVSDPMDKDGKPIDPYKVQTDIVFPKK